jgi:transposase
MEKTFGILEKQLVLSDHDKAPAHLSLLARDFLAKNNTTIMSQPPYSSDLAPALIFILTMCDYCIPLFSSAH